MVRLYTDGCLRTVLEHLDYHAVGSAHRLLPWNLDVILQRLDQRDAA
jgi:hypothetical protein